MNNDGSMAKQYLLVLLTVAASTLVGVELHKYIGFGFTLIYPPVIAAIAVKYGRNAARISIFLCVVCYWYFVLLQQSSVVAAEEQEAIFVVSLTAILFITERLTTKLHTANILLEERSRQLEEANQKLKATMQKREDFTAALSHDLKNPIIGANRLLEILHKEQADQRHAEIFDQLIISNRGMLQILHNILDSYRCEEGMFKPNAQSAKIDEAIKDCEAELRYALKKKNLNVVTVPTGLDSGSVWSEPVLLRRVLTNLLSNAVRYSPKDASIVVEIKHESGFAHIAVKDFGPGVTISKRDRLFERFEPEPDSRCSGGTGLGLYASRMIVEGCGGKISYSGPETADLSTFSVLWPENEADAIKVQPQENKTKSQTPESFLTTMAKLLK